MKDVPCADVAGDSKNDCSHGGSAMAQVTVLKQPRQIDAGMPEHRTALRLTSPKLWGKD